MLAIDDGRSCDRLRAWLFASGALVTHSFQPQQALEFASSRPEQFDIVLLDADVHPAWEKLAERIPRECSLLVVGSTSVDAVVLRRVLDLHAGYVSRDAAQPDFVCAIHNLVSLAAPDLGRLAARSARLWGLSPQLTHLLHYNLWGYSDRDIADALSISLKTTQQYQEELRRKTGVKTKQAYLRRLLTLSGQEPLLPMTDHTRRWVQHDLALLRGSRGHQH